MTSIAWRERAAVLHRRCACTATLLALAAAPWIRSAAPSTQLLGVVAAVVLLGVPHGAVDHRLAAPWFRARLGAGWPVGFAVVYLGLAATVVIVWQQLPVTCLVAFLSISLYHFGAGDARRPLAIVVRGAIPVLGPVLASPDATAPLFAMLAGVDVGAVRDVLHGWRGPVAIGLAGLLSLHVCERLSSRRHADAAEALLLATVMVLLPPLAAFAVYFCLWHSPRHALDVCSWFDASSPSRAWWRFARHALPMSAATIGIALVAFVLLWRADTDPTVAAVQLLFIGLASLTVPHMWITWHARELVGARAT